MSSGKTIIIEIIIGLVAILTIVMIKNNELKEENKELKEENQYLTWQLNEVPTIIESRKGDICNE